MRSDSKSFKEHSTIFLFQSISYILLWLHHLYKYTEFLNASNYTFPTNHLVWYCRDASGGGGDSREENIDRSFRPKSRLRITFFFLFYYFFHLTKKTGLQVHPSTTCKYSYWVKRGRKKPWMGRHSPLPDVILLRFNECWEAASVTWTQPNRWKIFNI